MAQTVKNLQCRRWGLILQCRRWGLIPGSGRPPGERNDNPLQDSGLENSLDRGAWQAPWGCKELNTTERLSLSLFTENNVFLILSKLLHDFLVVFFFNFWLVFHCVDMPVHSTNGYLSCFQFGDMLKKLLWTFVCKTLCTYMFSCILNISQNGIAF